MSKRIGSCNCDKCGRKVLRFKHLKKVNEGYLCKECIRENRKDHREFLKRDILGIRKRSDLLKEWAAKRETRKEEQERLRKIYGDAKPQIKKPKEDRLKINTLGLYLTKNEKLVLYKKLVHSGLSSEEANKRINNLSEQMKTLIEKLRNEVDTQEELNIKFKEGFAKLIEGVK